MKYPTNQSDLSESDRKLRISHFVNKTTLLGPHERFVLWVQGCCFSCRDCLAAELHDSHSGIEVSVRALADLIANLTDIEGITISGGEPFLQAHLLAQLIALIRQKRDLGVIIYTGFSFESLESGESGVSGATELIECADLIIDGQYINELDNDEFAVGSSNQKKIFLTSRYKEAAKKYYGVHGRKTEVILYPDRSVLVGVPSRQTLKIWNTLVYGKEDSLQDYENIQ